ncbi:MAG: hypothetical protein ABGY71_05285 [bacterium]|jgi:hypothetical protein|nr:hypothetical protein [Planctomycetota bacterium]
MGNVIYQPIVLASLSVTLIAMALVWSMRQKKGSERSRWWFAFTTLPGLLSLLTFYSLAIHMYFALGGWPDFYGTEGLTPELVTHADISRWLFSNALLLGLGMPVVLAFFAVVPRLRSNMIYPAFCGAICWLCLLMTALAPAGFQQWWWD